MHFLKMERKNLRVDGKTIFQLFLRDFIYGLGLELSIAIINLLILIVSAILAWMAQMVELIILNLTVMI
jgi:hypothetical protein